MGITKSLADGVTIDSNCYLQQNQLIGICSGTYGILIPNLR